jgi:hypothetical protein
MSNNFFNINKIGMKFRFIYLFVAALLFAGCGKEVHSYDETNSVLVSKQWQIAYVMEKRDKGPVLYNDNYLTTNLVFYSNGQVYTKINSNEYVGEWELIEIKSNPYLEINIPNLTYLSGGWVVSDMYIWGYDQMRLVLTRYDFDRGVNMEMGLK